MALGAQLEPTWLWAWVPLQASEPLTTSTGCQDLQVALGREALMLEFMNLAHSLPNLQDAAKRMDGGTLVIKMAGVMQARVDGVMQELLLASAPTMVSTLDSM